MYNKNDKRSNNKRRIVEVKGLRRGRSAKKPRINEEVMQIFDDKLKWIDIYIKNADRLVRVFLNQPVYKTRKQRYEKAIKFCGEVIQMYRDGILSTLTSDQKNIQNNIAETYHSWAECCRVLAELDIEYNVDKENISTEVFGNIIENFIRSLEVCEEYFRDFQQGESSFNNDISKKIINNVYWISAFFKNYISNITKDDKFRAIRENNWECPKNKNWLAENNTKEKILGFIQSCIQNYNEFKTSLANNFFNSGNSEDKLMKDNRGFNINSWSLGSDSDSEIYVSSDSDDKESDSCSDDQEMEQVGCYIFNELENAFERLPPLPFDGFIKFSGNYEDSSDPFESSSTEEEVIMTDLEVSSEESESVEEQKQSERKEPEEKCSGITFFTYSYYTPSDLNKYPYDPMEEVKKDTEASKQIKEKKDFELGDYLKFTPES